MAMIHLPGGVDIVDWKYEFMHNQGMTDHEIAQIKMHRGQSGTQSWMDDRYDGPEPTLEKKINQIGDHVPEKTYPGENR